MHHTAAARAARAARAEAPRETNATPHSHVILNRVIPLVLRSPLHGLLSRNLLLLTHTGRTSGKAYTIPVTYFEGEDGAIRMFSNQRWPRNLRGGAAVTLRLRGRDVGARADVIEDRTTVTREVAPFLATKGTKAARMINVQIDATRPPTEAEIATASREHVVVSVTLAPQGNAQSAMPPQT